MRSNRSRLTAWAVLSIAGLGVWTVKAMWTQEIKERDLFFPRTMAPPADRPERLLVEVPAEPGVTLRGWRLPHPTARGTLLYTYGNGDTVADSLDRLVWLRDALQVQVIAVDYRGYGFSDGTPSLDALLNDVVRVYDELIAPAASSDHPVIMFGRSMGTVPAIHLAAHRPLDGLILETPFTDVTAVISAWQRNLMIPLRWLIRLRPSRALAERRPQPSDLIRMYHGPLLVLHGDRDTVIPIELGRRMFDLSPSPSKVFCEFPGADHNNLFLDRPSAADALRRFAEDLMGTGQAADRAPRPGVNVNTRSG